MTAYVIVETDVTDPEQYEQYTAAAPATISASGGRFLVRGGEIAVLEGDWCPSRLVVLEFEDLEAAKRWYQSRAYQEARKLRAGAAAFRGVAVQGTEAHLPEALSAPRCVRVLSQPTIPRRPLGRWRPTSEPR